MSTSEFDEQSSEKEKDLLPLFCKREGLPDDFTAEDMAFAQELGNLFSSEDEEVPPYFVQTLLEPEHPRCQPVEQGFEQKTCAHVFRRLKLHRRLFQPSQSPARLFVIVPHTRRSFAALFAACVLFMLITMIASGNSFAAGLAILWSGPHSGVFQTSSYPQGLAAPTLQKQATQNMTSVEPREISLIKVQQELSFSMYWPSNLPDNYSPDTLSVIQGSDQLWTNGPMIELNCNYSLPGVKSHGTGHITIREFKPTDKILQVVQTGAAHQIEIENGDQGQVAVYVDGQWGQTSTVSQAWVFGTRSELIYEHNGIVFWIVGDQRDGINDTVLQNIASSMATLDIARAIHLDNSVGITMSLEDSSWLFAGDVMYEEGPNGTSLEVISSSTSRPITDANP